MNYYKIEKCSVSNGTGCRVVLFVSGCSHHCRECFNPETWDANSGIPFNEAAEQELFDNLNHDYISGITFGGGDPLFPANRETVTEIARKVKKKFPDKTIWLYTGYLFEEVKNLPIMQYADVVVDGKFVVEQKDITLAWRGSSNQRVWRKSKNGDWQPD